MIWIPAARTDLGAFYQAGVLAAVDVHAVQALGARTGEADPEVLLALALAVRAPRHGHVLIDLDHVRIEPLVPEFAAGCPPLPADRRAWRARVAASPLVREETLGRTPFVLRGSALYTDRYHHYETVLQEQFTRRFAATRPVTDAHLLDTGLDALFGARSAADPQRRAASAALTRGAVVVTGGPGTGKTWTVRNVLTLLYAQWASGSGGAAPPRVALAAPTGKASARVVEAIRDGLAAHVKRAKGALPSDTPMADLYDWLAGLQPFTLHRLLGWNPENPTRFRHDASRPLPFDVVLVDEVSMVDVALMAKLVEAVPPDSRLILLGDAHQLASVEAGTVLADLCGGAGRRDAVIVLEKSRRYRPDSGIARFADAALAGNELMAVAAVPPWSSEREVGRITTDDLRDLAVAGLRPTYERLRAGPRPGETHEALHAEVLARFDRFRVLAAHRRGSRGVEGLNVAMEAWLVAADLIADVSDPWYVGRPILVTRNDPGAGRFNGDVGMLVTDAHGHRVVAFSGPSGTVAYLPPARLPDHESVFAMTIHKSQGSEFDDVVLVLPERPSPVLTRELVYTGATRAKHRLAVLATPEVIASAVRRPIERASGLAARLG